VTRRTSEELKPEENITCAGRSTSAILFTLSQVLTAHVTGNAVLAAVMAGAQLISLR
jgi:uncharacterized membrane protein YoaK (UPF0700 family)